MSAAPLRSSDGETPVDITGTEVKAGSRLGHRRSIEVTARSARGQRGVTAKVTAGSRKVTTGSDVVRTDVQPTLGLETHAGGG